MTAASIITTRKFLNFLQNELDIFVYANKALFVKTLYNQLQ